MKTEENKDLINLEKVYEWKKDVFQFVKEALKIYPAEPLDSLKGKQFKQKDPYTGEVKYIELFDKDGYLSYHDLNFYKKKYFKNQEPLEFKRQALNAPTITLDEGTDDRRDIKVIYLTWQQTIELEAYQRAINTFDKDSYNIVNRKISIVSGHGIGKTSFASIITIHFLTTMFHSQIGATANSKDQLQDIYLKEFYIWKKRLPVQFGNQIKELNDKIVIDKDWFMRARVAGKDNPEALAGLHGDYVMLFIDEASGVWSKIFETMKGSLSGDNWLVIMTSNPTRSEGYFYDSQKGGSGFTKLHFNSEDSPIVKQGMIDDIIEDYGLDSDEYRIRVLGKFPDESEMDDKGWIPLFANMTINFEEESNQVIKNAILGVDPSGSGGDSTKATVRDSIYMKNVLSESKSKAPDLARKVEIIRDIYNIYDSDIGVDAFGVGAKLVAEYQPRQTTGAINAILSDKPREEDNRYNSFKSEMGWRFREWIAGGGIIITNKQRAWLREMDKIKYRRNRAGKIELMGKVEFKKEYGFSPDLFDSALHTFFKEEAYRKPMLTKNDREFAEHLKFLQRTETQGGSPSTSSM